MTTSMRSLLADLHHSINDETRESVKFVDVWERHCSVSLRAIERLVVEFGLTDLGQMCDRHLELFRLVDRASLTTSVSLSATVLIHQRSIAELVEECDSEAALVEWLRNSPEFARTVHHRIETTQIRRKEPLLLALQLIGDDQTSLWALTDVFMSGMAGASR